MNPSLNCFRFLKKGLNRKVMLFSKSIDYGYPGTTAKVLQVYAI